MRDDELERAVTEAMAPAIQPYIDAVTALIAHMGGPEGIREFLAEKEQWEDEHPDVPWGSTCKCFCRLKGHDAGTCAEDAETYEVVNFCGDLLQVLMCGPCGAASDERWQMNAPFYG